VKSVRPPRWAGATSMIRSDGRWPSTRPYKLYKGTLSQGRVSRQPPSFSWVPTELRALVRTFPRQLILSVAGHHPDRLRLLDLTPPRTVKGPFQKPFGRGGEFPRAALLTPGAMKRQTDPVLNHDGHTPGYASGLCVANTPPRHTGGVGGISMPIAGSSSHRSRPPKLPRPGRRATASSRNSRRVVFEAPNTTVATVVLTFSNAVADAGRLLVRTVNGQRIYSRMRRDSVGHRRAVREIRGALRGLLARGDRRNHRRPRRVMFKEGGGPGGHVLVHPEGRLHTWTTSRRASAAGSSSGAVCGAAGPGQIYSGSRYAAGKGAKTATTTLRRASVVLTKRRSGTLADVTRAGTRRVGRVRITVGRKAVFRQLSSRYKTPLAFQESGHHSPRVQRRASTADKYERLKKETGAGLSRDCVYVDAISLGGGCGADRLWWTIVLTVGMRPGPWRRSCWTGGPELRSDDKRTVGDTTAHDGEAATPFPAIETKCRITTAKIVCLPEPTGKRHRHRGSVLRSGAPQNHRSCPRLRWT